MKSLIVVATIIVDASVMAYILYASLSLHVTGDWKHDVITAIFLATGIVVLVFATVFLNCQIARYIERMKK